MKRAPTLDILGLFLATRLLLIIVTYFGYILLTQEKYSSMPISLHTFITSWNQWDAAIYTRIAQSGYKPPYDLAFSPLYPLLIHVIASPFNSLGYQIVGMLLSNVALLGTLFVLYQLAVEMGGEQVARRTLLYLCIFPTAFFFFTSYNEALFLFLTSAFFLALRREHWWLAGLLGLLASLTRSVGVLLVVPYLYELWLIRENIWSVKRNLLIKGAPLLLIPLGTLMYCFYCWKLTGNPIAFATVQTHWSRHTTWPWQGLWQAFFEFFWNQPFGSFNQVHILLDLSATSGFIALALYGFKRQRISYSIWMGLLLLSTLCSASIDQHDSLISNQRFVLEMFPGFILLALLGTQHPRLHQILAWCFPALLATLSLLFVLGKWMV